jgi:hypothetical protein
VNVPIQRIITAVADGFGIPESQILSTNRGKSAAGARQLCYLLAREVTKWSYPDLGKAFKRDHTTVMSGCARAVRAIRRDTALRGIYESVLRAELELGKPQLLAELKWINSRIANLRKRGIEIAARLGMGELDMEAAE